MSEPKVPHDVLIRGYARQNDNNQLGQLIQKAKSVAELEDQPPNTETIQRNFEEMVREARIIAEEEKDKPLEYPPQDI